MTVAAATDKMLARKEGRVGTMIFNNPERHNAVSLEMWAAATRILEDFARDDDIRVVVGLHDVVALDLQLREDALGIDERLRAAEADEADLAAGGCGLGFDGHRWTGNMRRRRIIGVRGSSIDTDADAFM